MTATPPAGDTSLRYYVIVGCGFSGILNHALLRHPSNTRVGSLPILHVGSKDPWWSYYSMPMGQWPTLLTLPAFSHQPSSIARCANLGSSEFADINQRQWNALYAARPFHHEDARLVAIRSIGPGAYEIELDNGRIFNAAYIDVCGGPGPSRTPPSAMSIDPNLMNEFRGMGMGPGGWPRLLSGETFLNRMTPTMPSAARICVYGGGPTGAWCVERAESMGHAVFWVAAEKLNAAFVASRRNDGLVVPPVVRKPVNGDHVITGNLRPSNPTTVFGENLDATAIVLDTFGQVEVQLQPAATGTPRFIGPGGPFAFPTTPGLRVAQVVLSIGQETGHAEPRSWASLLRSVFGSAIHAGAHFIIDRQGLVVGMQSLDNRVRLLGAAALSHPDVQVEWAKPGTPSNLYFRSLVEQARVRNGITLSALTIAEANGLWSSGVNGNLNTAGLKDLLQLTSGWPVGLDGAQSWFEMRGSRISPFERLEFQKLATHKVTY
jgi:hypothetical protein